MKGGKGVGGLQHFCASDHIMALIYSHVAFYPWIKLGSALNRQAYKLESSRISVKLECVKPNRWNQAWIKHASLSISSLDSSLNQVVFRLKAKLDTRLNMRLNQAIIKHDSNFTSCLIQTVIQACFKLGIKLESCIITAYFKLDIKVGMLRLIQAGCTTKQRRKKRDYKYRNG